ncbi:MAG: PIN domain-containing protein, partial [Parvibaculum sp.]
MIVLDTNIISEFSRKEPDRRASEWLRHRSFSELATCTPVISELWYGASRVMLRAGSRRYLEAFDRV